MDTTKINGKPYPVPDGARGYHYVKAPVLVTKDIAYEHEGGTLAFGKWVGANVVAGGYVIPPFPGQHDTEALCQKACDAHNNSIGFTVVEVDDILWWSMSTAED